MNRNNDVRECRFHGRYEVEMFPVNGLVYEGCPECAMSEEEKDNDFRWLANNPDYQDEPEFFACGICGNEIHHDAFLNFKCPECSAIHNLAVVAYEQGVPMFLWIPKILLEVREWQ